jgi:hypothetical protein
MSKRTIIIGGILLIILIIIALVFLTPQGIVPNNGNQPSPTPLGAVEISPIPRGNSSAGFNSYQEFLASGKSEICTFTVNTSDGPSNGTVYAANGKIRGEFTVPTTQGTLQQYMLIDSYMAYMWTNSSNSGVKFAVQDKTPGQYVNNAIFKCSDWVPNSSIFEIPSNITFTNIISVPFPSPTP